MYVEGDIPTMCGNNNNGFGNGWEGLIGLALVASLFGGGWGNGGFGFGGRGSGGAGTEFLGYELGRVATTNDVASGFSTSAIMSNQRDTQLAMQQGFSDTAQTLCRGFSDINLINERGFATTNYNMATGLCNLGYQTQQGFTNLGSKIDMCCCDLKQMNLENRYLNEKQTCDIIQAINCANQRLVDIYTNDKIDTLNRKLAVAENQLSQNAQTSAIVSALMPKQPIPSYQVPNPNCCYNTCGCNNSF